MATSVEIVPTVALQGWARQLGGFSRVLPSAAAYALNGTVFAMRDDLRDTARRVFDRPDERFSIQNAWAYTRARPSPDGLKARIALKDKQSTYFKYQILGGRRLPGDVGAAKRFMFVPIADETINPKTGGLKRNVLQSLYRRSGLGRRDVSASTRRRDRRKQPVFFGKVYGVLGIWERPKRTPAALPRRRGVRQVRNERTPRLLLAAFLQQDYARPGLFPYAAITARAYDDYNSRLGQAIQAELQALIDRGET